ncbi:hypothetical protein MBM_08630 [Drepanopeziza brunnea f. sp. 'multigermtubi' MB_m1]|uniref:Uncharacterized protein n=1 Tax=Marssonina brunnea f. sp. multigermtubi (strain MB_m1) TaxID=1072389 RepID=K1WLR6_MARBU|nr:uncharacterized protein MBM_08630 [Drepanopeziza brunnea f. sp. 'multigermtubi' MB_m1]EKD13187.1 hypothetical protein MBM_08630 [Drepanopeziza brunnea f. sp. 'multigermtubi' MB_m1]
MLEELRIAVYIEESVDGTFVEREEAVVGHGDGLEIGPPGEDELLGGVGVGVGVDGEGSKVKVEHFVESVSEEGVVEISEVVGTNEVDAGANAGDVAGVGDGIALLEHGSEYCEVEVLKVVDPDETGAGAGEGAEAEAEVGVVMALLEDMLGGSWDVVTLTEAERLTVVGGGMISMIEYLGLAGAGVAVSRMVSVVFGPSKIFVDTTKFVMGGSVISSVSTKVSGGCVTTIVCTIIAAGCWPPSTGTIDKYGLLLTSGKEDTKQKSEDTANRDGVEVLRRIMG